MAKVLENKGLRPFFMLICRLVKQYKPPSGAWET